MSYRRSGLGMPMPGMAPTTWFAGGMEPFAERLSPAGSIYAPYGWGPDFMVGMPMNYTHHIDYVQEPVRVVRADMANARRSVPGARPIGPMRDTLAVGNYDHGQYEGDMQSLGSYYETQRAHPHAPQKVARGHQRRAMGDDSGDGLSGL